MKAIFLWIALFTCSGLVAQDTITTFILVRHAEKQNDGTSDPDLSETGNRRAAELAQLLEHTTIKAIYSTKYKRTCNTVAPLAKQKGIDIQLYDPFKEESIKEIATSNKGESILIVGHSNNIPWIANLLTGTKEFADWKEDEYENVLLISVLQFGQVAKVTRLTLKVN